MKQLTILFFAFVTMQLSAQNLKSMTSKADSMTKEVSSSSSLIDKLAGDQVKKLTKKLNLSESQQQQATDLVVTQLKSEKFTKLLGSLGANKLMGGSGLSADKSKEISKALMSDPDFKKGMSDILDDDQKSKMKDSTMKDSAMKMKKG